MNLDDLLVGHAGALMQAIDILGDDVGNMAAGDEFGYCMVAWTRLGIADRFTDHQEATPRFEARLCGTQEVAEGNGFVLRPEPAG